MTNRMFNVPDFANDSITKSYYTVDGDKITTNTFILTHPKTGERVIQNIFSTNNFHLKATDAIDLSNTLINLATIANEINTNENAILMTKNTFRRYLESGKFKQVTLELIGNYNSIVTKTREEEQSLPGYFKFRITPTWYTLAKPNPDMDYYFVDYIYISPFYSEFERQMDFYGGVENIKFINFSHEDYIKQINDMLVPENMPEVDCDCNCNTNC